MEKLQDWRQRLYIIIFFTNTPAGQRFDRYLLLTILASLVVVMLDSVETAHQDYGDLFMALEWGFTALFAIEYALRIYISPKPREYIFSFYGLIDLLGELVGLYRPGVCRCAVFDDRPRDSHAADLPRAQAHTLSKPGQFPAGGVTRQ